MAKTQTPETAEHSEFDLKHRITGAAVLLFFGALVLPWLLGPPSEASKVDIAAGVDSALVNGVDIEPIVVGDGGSLKKIEVAETVYISKITPLDAQSDKQLAAAANKAADNESSGDEPEAGVTTKPISKAPTPSESKSEKPSQSSVVVTKQESIDKKAEAKKLADAKQAAQTKKNAELAKAKQDKQKREKEQREKELQAALAAEAKDDKRTASVVDVGWVVQVGLFTEKSRAIALISELKNKGFTASKSVVDTNRGPKTGTRVWLGPYAKRSGAQTEQKRLKSKAGKDGFIRVYP